jgi:hypothetical protein
MSHAGGCTNLLRLLRRITGDEDVQVRHCKSRGSTKCCMAWARDMKTWLRRRPVGRLYNCLCGLHIRKTRAVRLIGRGRVQKDRLARPRGRQCRRGVK